MADFKSFALQYVLADEGTSREDAAIKAAAAIKSAIVRSTAVLSWVQSIDPWMPSGVSQSGPAGTGHAHGESEFNVMTRARALDFLADTLSLLDRSLLRTDQVHLLLAFFSRLFVVDHKAGIMAAARALRQLVDMKAFRPVMAEGIMQSIVSMGDDFRLQPPRTRLEIYTLLHTLVADGSVSGQLQHTYGGSGGFISGLLELCSHERDPGCLMQWFRVLHTLISDFDLSADVDDEIFKSFSAYFPISMRSSVNPAGITVDDLKVSLRACFAASDRLARLVLPFLIQKLDQGDSVTVTVKADVLRTILSCLEHWRNPASSIAPYIGQIWGSLKYEVRNGEVQEIIDCTLDVMRTISTRLACLSLAPSVAVAYHQGYLRTLTAMVLDDCLEDLSNPAYTKPAGLLLRSILEVHPRPFALMVPVILDTITKVIDGPRTSGHAKECLGVLTSLLEARTHLLRPDARSAQPGLLQLIHDLDSQILGHAHAALARHWKENNTDKPGADNVAILEEVVRGFATLVCQPGRLDGDTTLLLCGEDQCEQICSTLSDRVISMSPLASSAGDFGPRKELSGAIVAALRRIVSVYPQGYSAMVTRAVAAIYKRNWGEPASRSSIHTLKTLLLRLSYIGCSGEPGAQPPLWYLQVFMASMYRVVISLLDQKASFEASTVAVSAIYNALLHFKDACIRMGPFERRDQISVDWKKFTADFGAHNPDFTLTDGEASHRPAPVGARTDGKVERTKPADEFRNYLECFLYVVISLYRRAMAPGTQFAPAPRLGLDFATDAAPGEAAARIAKLQDVYLHQLADMATAVIRDLEEEEQQSLQLSGETYNLFSLTEPSNRWLAANDSGRTNVLSLGILRGMRPGALTPMFVSETIARDIVSDIVAAHSLPERTQKVRDCILMVLSNKWVPRPGMEGPQRQSWKATVASLELLVRESYLGDHSSGTRSMETYSRILAVLSGAIARRDNDISGLATIVSGLPAAAGEHGEWMARCLSDLVSSHEQLDGENHAIVRPLHQQWVYVHIVRPKLEVSFPTVRDRPEAIVQAISVVHLLKHMTFPIYEGDVDSIVRILIAGISTSFSEAADSEAAVRLLRRVLQHKPDALKDQIKALMLAVVRVLSSGLDASAGGHVTSGIPTRFAGQGSLAHCRRDALILLKEMAQTFDRGLLGQYSAHLSRVLGDACGDPVREVRQSALAARSSWAKVAP